jgi:hypothetical protein
MSFREAIIVKSSVNGVDKAAKPVGTPKERLDKWMLDFDGGRYNNLDPVTQKNLQELKDAYTLNKEPKGLWVQVGVPAKNVSSIVDLDVIINLW